MKKNEVIIISWKTKGCQLQYTIILNNYWGQILLYYNKQLYYLADSEVGLIYIYLHNNINITFKHFDITEGRRQSREVKGDNTAKPSSTKHEVSR